MFPSKHIRTPEGPPWLPDPECELEPPLALIAPANDPEPEPEPEPEPDPDQEWLLHGLPPDPLPDAEQAEGK